MSVLGTGVAAGVAQTGVQAQQAAREREKINEQSARERRRVREAEADHLLTLTDQDDTDGDDKIQISGQLPRRQAPVEPPKGHAKDSPNEPDDKPDNPQDDGLYHHVDMKA